MTITDSIKYIGVDDLNIDLFESQYIVPNGISYNSYLVIDEKIAVMDTVDKRMSEQWWINLENELNGKTPDYLIVHHMEPDHAGVISEFMAKYPKAKIVASDKAIKMLPLFFNDTDFSNRTISVGENDTLSLGTHLFRFIMAPMVHWPEVMVTYDETNKVLFSADAFGKFGALSHDEDWACEARRYYFNICGKYGVQVQNLLKKASTLDIATICPLHGPILSENLGYYINLYDIWSSYRPEKTGVFIAYASIHGNTAEVAQRFAEILHSKGIENVSVTDLSRCDMAEAVEDAFKMSHIVLAASSYDAGVFPPMNDFLHHLHDKTFRNRTVALIENGSWAPSAGRTMRAALEKMKDINMIEPLVTINGKLKASDESSLQTLANNISTDILK